MITPRVFTNHNRQLLTPADLDNHPLAQEYIEYTRHMHYPCDFKEWLYRREKARKNADEVDRIRIREAMAEPFCQSEMGAMNNDRLNNHLSHLTNHRDIEYCDRCFLAMEITRLRVAIAESPSIQKHVDLRGFQSDTFVRDYEEWFARAKDLIQ